MFGKTPQPKPLHLFDAHRQVVAGSPALEPRDCAAHGTIARIPFVRVLRFGVPTSAGIVHTAALWHWLAERTELRSAMEARRTLGAYVERAQMRPDGFMPGTYTLSHLVTGVEIRKDGVYQSFELLSSDRGRYLKEDLLAGKPVNVCVIGSVRPGSLLARLAPSEYLYTRTDFYWRDE
jgi:hypothetical protein